VAGLEDSPSALKTPLLHLIVSHHGEVKKGALREPMLAEAVALHAMDELGARLEQVWLPHRSGTGGRRVDGSCAVAPKATLLRFKQRGSGTARGWKGGNGLKWID